MERAEPSGLPRSLGRPLILAAVLSLAIGISLGMLGGGGSILTVPILVYALGVEERAALASSLLVVGTTSLVALVRPARAGIVAWRTGLTFAGAGMLGSFAGGKVSAFVDERILLSVFAALMLGTAIAMLRGRREQTEAREMRLVPALLTGLSAGALTGLVGAGGGFVIVPALALVGGLPMRTAIGTSLLVIALQSFAGFLGHLSHATVDAALIGTVTASASVGAVLGGAFGDRVPQEQLRRGFGVFVLVMGLYMGWRQLGTAPGAAPESPSAPAAAG